MTFEQLARSATTSAEATSGRFAFLMEMTTPDAPEQFAFSGEGAFDAAARRASLSFDLSSLASLLGGLFAGFGGGADVPDFGDPSQWQLESVQDGDVMYMRLPAVSGELPDGKTWVRVDLRKDGESKGFDFSELEQFTSNDPRKALDLLRAASGEIEIVGSETLRDTETTHYRATVDVRDYERLVPASEREKARLRCSATWSTSPAWGRFPSMSGSTSRVSSGSSRWPSRRRSQGRARPQRWL